MRKKILHTTVLCILLALLIGGKFRIIPVQNILDSWENYTPILIEDSVSDEIDIYSFFKDLGWTDIVCRDSEQVHLFTYRGEMSIPYRQVGELLEPEDPRYDPYLRGLSGYFEGSINGRPAEVFYIAGTSEQNHRWKQTIHDLEESGILYSVPGREESVDILYLALIFLNAGILIFLLPQKSRMLFLSGAAAVFVLSDAVSFPLFTLLMAQVIGWALFCEWAGISFPRHFNIGYSFLRRDLKTRIAGYILITGIGLTVALTSLRYSSAVSIVFHWANTAAIHGILACFYYRWTRRKVGKQHHTLFFPIPMSRGKRNSSGRVLRFVLLLTTLAVLPVFVVFHYDSADDRQIIYPQPVSDLRYRDFQWEDLKEWKKEKGSEKLSGELLPDICDYLSHRAYQQGYLYGRKFSFPYKGEELSVKVYEKQGLKIFGKDKVFKMFTEKWYEDIISDASKSGVSRLLFAQNGSVQIAQRKINTFRIPTHTILGYIALFLVIGPVVYFYVSRKMNRQKFSFDKYQQKKGQKVA